jgi:hypothetical protein
MLKLAHSLGIARSTARRSLTKNTVINISSELCAAPADGEKLNQQITIRRIFRFTQSQCNLFRSMKSTFPYPYRRSPQFPDRGHWKSCSPFTTG